MGGRSEAPEAVTCRAGRQSAMPRVVRGPAWLRPALPDLPCVGKAPRRWLPRAMGGGAAVTLTVGSLFSGVGGLDLGLERAGMRVVWHAENDPYCCRVLAEHWPHVPNLGDVTLIDWSEVPRVDLITGGFPCQAVSVAGRRRGALDDRWLWPELARAVRMVRPDYVLVENVPGLASLGLDRVLADLASLGFDAEWAPLSACTVGAPHARSRLFVVAYTPGVGRAAGHLQGDGAGQALDQEPEPRERWRRSGDSVGDDWLAPDPGLHRVGDGFPTGLDIARLRALGNAVVPQVAEHVGRLIVQAAA